MPVNRSGNSAGLTLMLRLLQVFFVQEQSSSLVAVCTESLVAQLFIDMYTQLVVFKHVKPDPPGFILPPAVVFHFYDGGLADPAPVLINEYSTKLDTPAICLQYEDKVTAALSLVIFNHQVGDAGMIKLLLMHFKPGLYDKLAGVLLSIHVIENPKLFPGAGSQVNHSHSRITQYLMQ